MELVRDMSPKRNCGSMKNQSPRGLLGISSTMVDTVSNDTMVGVGLVPPLRSLPLRAEIQWSMPWLMQWCWPKCATVLLSQHASTRHLPKSSDCPRKLTEHSCCPPPFNRLPPPTHASKRKAAAQHARTTGVKDSIAVARN